MAIKQTSYALKVLVAYCLLASLPSEASIRAITKCVLTNGELLFTDQACPNVALHTHAFTPAPVNTLQPLSAGQTNRVNDLNEEHRRQCHLAVTQLAKLHKKRKSGYRVKEASSLDDRESELKELRNQSC